MDIKPVNLSEEQINLIHIALNQYRLIIERDLNLIEATKQGLRKSGDPKS